MTRRREELAGRALRAARWDEIPAYASDEMLERHLRMWGFVPSSAGANGRRPANSPRPERTEAIRFSARGSEWLRELVS